ncbi:amidohydrolase [Cytophagales bacterium WSM2-2]|nr:amidohydrolase [Cytophagales bacterium WSM2-2]
MDREVVLENYDVVVKDGKVKAMGKSQSVKFDKAALVVDAKGKYLIPGLAEMHAHVPPIDDINPMKEVLMLFALNGVTTVRGMLGHPRHLELRKKIEEGEIMGPKLYTSGPSFNGNTVKSAEEGIRMVKEQKAAGYDFLKLHPGLSRENFDAIVKTANEVKIPFAGHVAWDVGIWHAIESNYKSVDHLDQFVEGLIPNVKETKETDAGFMAIYIANKADESIIPKLMAGLRDHHIWVVPTQTLAEGWLSSEITTAECAALPEMKYMDPATAKRWAEAKDRSTNDPRYKKENFPAFLKLRRKLILECQKNGVGLLLGSDAPQVYNVPGFSIHRELKSMVNSGLTPFQALQAGTVNVARYFDRSNSGSVKEGNVSDLVLLNANPLTDISNTSQIAGVMLNNRWLSREFIDAELKKLVKQ